MQSAREKCLSRFDSHGGLHAEGPRVACGWMGVLVHMSGVDIYEISVVIHVPSDVSKTLGKVQQSMCGALNHGEET